MHNLLQHSQKALLLAALGIIGFGLIDRHVGRDTAHAHPNDAKIVVSPAPAYINDLSMEVAALRTLYLLKAGPDQSGDRPSSYGAIKFAAKDCAQKPRQRQEAKVSKNYRKLLTDLRAAFIANQMPRINELSEQLEDLNQDELPELDDVVEVSDQSRKSAPTLLRTIFDANRIAMYIAAYGKDFPDPYYLMWKNMRPDGKGTKPTPEQWQEIRDFVIKEVSWQIGGLDRNAQQKVGEQVAKALDRAYPLSNEELKKEFSKAGVGLRGEIGRIVSQVGPTDVIKHVLEQDFAEMLSNPRLLPAIEAREAFLKK